MAAAAHARVFLGFVGAYYPVTPDWMRKHQKQDMIACCKIWELANVLLWSPNCSGCLSFTNGSLRVTLSSPKLVSWTHLSPK